MKKGGRAMDRRPERTRMLPTTFATLLVLLTLPVAHAVRAEAQ